MRYCGLKLLLAAILSATSRENIFTTLVTKQSFTSLPLFCSILIDVEAFFTLFFLPRHIPDIFINFSSFSL
jgi:hypothetical protein